ncbi:gar1-domain-containing protein, partial [Stemphylium lycopersici]
CIRKWLKGGQGNTNACPTCRYVLVPKPSPRGTFDTPTIWKALCDQPPERLHTVTMNIWSGLQILWQRHPMGSFTVTSILDQAVIPALISASRYARPPVDRSQDAILDCHNLIAASWDSLGRPNLATGLAVPLVRLARLMASAGAVLPKWLTTSSRTNRLIWRANACLPITEEHITWDFIIEAAQLTSARYFHLLHLYTVFISQSIAHFPAPRPYPVKRHEVMNMVVERCCLKIGGNGCAWKDWEQNACWNENTSGFGRILSHLIAASAAECTTKGLLVAANSYLAAQVARNSATLKLDTANFEYAQSNKAADIKKGLLSTPFLIDMSRSAPEIVACASYTMWTSASGPNPYVVSTQTRHADSDTTTVSKVDTVTTTTGDLFFAASKALSYVRGETWTQLPTSSQPSGSLLKPVGDVYLPGYVERRHRCRQYKLGY